VKTGVTDFSTFRDGKPPRRMRPDFWVEALLEFMDVCAYVAIWLTAEVRIWPFIAAAVVLAFRTLTRLRVRPIWVIAGYVFLIFGAAQLSLRSQVHPLVSTAHVAPIAIAALGLMKGSERLWGWRMGLGFIGLILACSLSPEFSVTLMILAYIVAGSIAIACRFLADAFSDRGVVGVLPPGFIRTSLKQSIILFVAALVIFPLIPRMQGRAGGGNEPSKTGYVEEVSLAEWNRVSSKGASAPALRIYGPDGRDPMDFIPDGLLRSRVLSVLHDRKWEPMAPKPAREGGETPPDRLTSLQIVREMTGPATLPVPYGTWDASVEQDGEFWRAQQTVTGEWREPRSRNKRFTYTVRVGRDVALLSSDKPGVIDTRVPDDTATPRVRELAAKLFKGLDSDRQKIRAVYSFFTRENFQAAYAENDNGRDFGASSRLPPLERFLFVEKSGHCELFASATAILLRLGGVPARLIAGFRVSGNAFGDVLTVRQEDAHAWVEAYIETKEGGIWRTLDFTPRILRISRFTDWMRDGYDWMSAKWTQYITNYGEVDSTFESQYRALKAIGRQLASGKNPFKSANSELNLYLFLVFFLIGAMALSFGAVAAFRGFDRRRRRPKRNRWLEALVRERARFERSAKRTSKSAPVPAEIARARRDWVERYESARFGAVDDDAQGPVLDELRAERLRIERDSRAG
jgi:transglutaminase-like putative cysteine protease